MSDQGLIRVGFIGAGGICRSRHLPGLAKIAGAEVVAVCNRSRTSGEAVARDFGIPEVMDDRRKLIARDDLDAIFIGTWPYMHREMSVAALEAGKHVLVEARMTMDGAAANAMCAAANAHPQRASVICAPRHRMPFEPFVRKTLADGVLGQVTLVELYHSGGGNLDCNSVTWREQAKYSGLQVLAMGICAETLNAWVGRYETLMAQTATPIAQKRDADGATVDIDIPQVATITGTLESGALIVEHHAGTIADKTTPRNQITIYGLEGTLRHDFFSGEVLLAKAGEELKPANVPAELRRDWMVEADFIDAVRAANAGKAWKVSPDFDEGLDYMRKVEAVHRSAAEGRAIRPADL